MSRQDQISLLKRLLHYVDTRTTAMADAPWRNEVSAYTDPGRLANEQRILFRQHPIRDGFRVGVVRARQLPHRRLCRRTRSWSCAGATASCAHS